MIGLLGKKIGMTQVFLDGDVAVPVTVISASGNRVVGLRTLVKNRYEAVQVGYGENKKEKRKTLLNGFPDKKRPAHVKEFRIDGRRENNISDYTVGQELPVTSLQVGGHLDITSVTMGKGFQGVVRRFGMHGGPATHGSKFHRHPGSVGQGTKPGRIVKGRKMPGRMGGLRVTMQNLVLVDVDDKNGLLIVKGSIPGKRNSLVIIRESVKKHREAITQRDGEKDS